VQAYIWPAAGGPGEESVQVYVCGAVNGADNTDGDRALLHAGFLVAQGFVTDLDVQSDLADAGS
jgi:hypothetical protein